MGDNVTIVHTIPANDTQDHDTMTHTCWCRPAMDFRHDKIFIVHNLADETEVPPWTNSNCSADALGK